MHASLQRLRHYYERHELACHLLFFLGGFLFDIMATREGVDHLLIIVQQIIYLLVIGGILYVDFIREATPDAMRFGARLERWWEYRGLLLHFCLGTLMNLYSIFFFMSASLFSSVVFVLVLFGAVALNEMKAVQASGVDIKFGLYALDVFCFFSLMIPMWLGRVGRLPFVLSLLATLAVLGLYYLLLRRRLTHDDLRRRLIVPGAATTSCFLLFYLLGVIPPVPVAAKRLDVYHQVERRGETFLLSHERPAWKFWRSADQDFAAEPGDRVYVFVAVFSPTNFDDTVFVRWSRYDDVRGWTESDRLPLRITGGRREGFRGSMNKQNYTAGRWRVSVETSDGREISRRYFTITNVPVNPNRVLTTEAY